MTRKQNVSDDGYQLKNNSLIFNYLLKIFQKNFFFSTLLLHPSISLWHQMIYTAGQWKVLLIVPIKNN